MFPDVIVDSNSYLCFLLPTKTTNKLRSMLEVGLHSSMSLLLLDNVSDSTLSYWLEKITLTADKVQCVIVKQTCLNTGAPSAFRSSFLFHKLNPTNEEVESSINSVANYSNEVHAMFSLSLNQLTMIAAAILKDLFSKFRAPSTCINKTIDINTEDGFVALCREGKVIKNETRPQNWANFSIVLDRFITVATKGELTSVDRTGKCQLIAILIMRQASLNSIPQTVGDLW